MNYIFPIFDISIEITFNRDSRRIKSLCRSYGITNLLVNKSDLFQKVLQMDSQA
jgi:hypothetical protein